jgi:Domain of unknown function DUF29
MKAKSREKPTDEKLGAEPVHSPSLAGRGAAGHGVQIDEDFHGWLMDQASALRNGQWRSLDCEHLAEELEAMAAGERRELLNRLTTLCEHLLKCQFQPDQLAHRGRGWRLTIARSRTEIQRILEHSPGLKGQLNALLADAYSAARRHAGVAMSLERREWEGRFPVERAWSVDQILDNDFLPTHSKSD